MQSSKSGDEGENGMREIETLAIQQILDLENPDKQDLMVAYLYSIAISLKTIADSFKADLEVGLSK
jgi:hypothetical protein